MEGLTNLGFDMIWLPSGLQTWLAGRSPINGGFDRKITGKWSIFQRAMFHYRMIEGGTLNSGPAVFACSQHGVCIKSTTITGFLLSIWKPIIHFGWSLHDFEAMNSQFYHALPMSSIHVQHARTFCLSTCGLSQPASSACFRCPSLCDKPER